MQNLLPANGEMYYFPQVFSREDAQNIYLRLSNEISWKQEPIKIFGKEIMQPRLTAWYGDVDYSYSGITMRSLKWTPLLLELKAEAEKISQCRFNSVLLNFYRNGRDSMGWHRDNENELGPAPSIASLSFGAERKFQVREYHSKENLQTIPTQNGSLILMKGKMQTYWEHRVPKEPKILEGRINLTFRSIV